MFLVVEESPGKGVVGLRVVDVDWEDGFGVLFERMGIWHIYWGAWVRKNGYFL